MSQRQIVAILKTLLFLVVAPGTILLYIPYRLLNSSVPLPQALVNWLAIIPCAAGVAVLLRCAWEFAAVGLGTPAPIDPPKTLVVTGLYRYVRNPMYVGFTLVLAGEAWLFHSRRIIEFAALLAAWFCLFVLGFEERGLRRTFGASYETYCESVPRWIPRLTPWHAGR